MARIVSEERAKSNRLRNKILKRDNYKCQLCGSQEDLEVHHMQALVYKGKSIEDNLITLCDECHRYAPQDGMESNQNYMKERNKFIYEQMIKDPDISSMITVVYVEFLKQQIEEYVKLGFIDEQQKNLILMFETNKVF